MNNITFLNVNYKDKEEAKYLGCKWDEINKKWFISKGILEDIEFNSYLKNLLNNVFKMEYLKFSLLPNATHTDESIISETMKNIVNQNKIEDIGYIKNKLEKLNKTF